MIDKDLQRGNIGCFVDLYNFLPNPDTERVDWQRNRARGLIGRIAFISQFGKKSPQPQSATERE